MDEPAIEITGSESEVSSLTFHVSDSGKRLDAFLAEKVEGWSRSRLQRLIEDGDVLVNEKTVKASYKLRENDLVEVELTEAPTAVFEPENIPLDIVFEDEYLAVINKPAGMIVHPGAGVDSGTLANALAYHFGMRKIDLAATDEQSKIQNLKSKIGMVHRLDKDTSGLIVVAKNEEVHEALSDQFRNREVFKSYVALVHGVTKEESGTVEANIGRDRNNRLRMRVQSKGRYALSLWKVRQRFERFTLLDVEIKTGRTHQIRVHLACIKHPVVGDEIYNEGRDKSISDAQIRKAVQNMGRFFLHAERLGFTHPISKQRIDFTSPIPAELEDFLLLIS